MSELWKSDGTTFVCEVPKELGKVTKIEQKRGKIIVRTESEKTMIVPVGKKE